MGIMVIVECDDCPADEKWDKDGDDFWDADDAMAKLAEEGWRFTGSKFNFDLKAYCPCCAKEQPDPERKEQGE